MQEILGLAALLRRQLAGEDLSAFGHALIEKATQDPDDAASLMDAAIIFQFRGEPELAQQLQTEALKLCRTYRIPPAKPVSVRVLALMAPGTITENVPLECLVEGSGVELLLYYASATSLNPAHIPDHDLLFVAIAGSDAHRQILDAWRPLLAGWPRPVVNAPGPLGALTQDGVRDGLSRVPGVRTSVKDCCGADGLYRRMRVVLMQGQSFAVHLAVATHEIAHYLYAGMAESAEKRAEEAAFIADFASDNGFAARHRRALAGIEQAIGLDYLVIDCAEAADGALIVFDADPTLAVHAMDSAGDFPYRQPAMAEIFTAFHAMLRDAAQREPPSLLSEKAQNNP